MRIDKFISDTAIFSRSQISQVIKSGRVKVNGIVIKKSDFDISKADKVELDGQIVIYSKYIYCVFNKPAGYVTSMQEKGEHIVYELLPEYFLRKNVVPIGRLDKDTTGLLFLTNDGQFCHKMTSPKHNVEKEYIFELADKINREEVEKLQSGTILKNGEETLPCRIEMINDTNGKIILSEGKYHQIKRMFASVGNKIIKLKRVREGKYILPQNLKEGEYIFVKMEDIL